MVIWPLVRKTEATYDCAAVNRPQNHVKFSGPSIVNLRRLSPPTALELLK